MTITLTITSYQKAALGRAATRQFDQSGGSFGRDAANDWVLPDPERFISGIHGVIYYSDGSFWLRDESTNGIGVGSDRVPVGKHRSVPLRDGETLTVGEYQIAVSVSDAYGDSVPAPADTPVPDAHPEEIIAPTFDPLKALGDSTLPPDTPAVHSAPPIARGSEPDHAPAFHDPFRPPHAVPEIPAGERAAPRWAVIPDDWDSAPSASPEGASLPQIDSKTDTTATPRSASQPAPASESVTIEPPTSVPPSDDASASGTQSLIDTPEAEPVATEPAVTEPPVADLPVAQPPPTTPPDSEPAVPEPSIAESMIDQSAAPAPPSTEPRTPESAARSERPSAAPGADAPGDDHADAPGGDPLRIFLKAAGLDPSHLRLADDRQALQQFGEMFHHLLDGFMRLLRARAEMKNELRLAQTTIRPRENNPLKFCVGPADALQLLFAARSPGYLSPQAAVEEAVDDLAAHQIAMLAGMRAAVDDLIAKIAPERFQPRDDNGQPMRSWYPNQREGQAWRQYAKFHQEVMSVSDVAFRQLIAERFMQVYEEQCRLLTKPRT